MKNYIAVLFLLATTAIGNAATYYSGPEGQPTGEGLESNPWPSLEKSIAAGLLQKLVPGDVLYLKNGYHGYVEVTGLNDDFITISAAPENEDVRLAQLSLSKASKWHMKNLRISHTFGTKPYGSYSVSFGHNDEASEQIIIEGCEVFSAEDHTKLSAKQWIDLKSSIQIGQHANDSLIKNCYIRNTRFAIDMSAENCTAEGNVIENFSGDGIRMTRDGQTAKFNVIKYAFAGGEEGDSNHDDAIQCFLFNKGTGTMRNLVIKDNLITGQFPGSQPHAAVNQGIGLFDGPLMDFKIDGNVVMTNHWHGVSVFDGQNCQITNNITWSEFGGEMKPWIMLGNKRGKAKDNTVTDNYSTRFRLGQPGTINKRNKFSSKKIYKKKYKILSDAINEVYGEYHPIAQRYRITGDLLK